MRRLFLGFARNHPNIFKWFIPWVAIDGKLSSPPWHKWFLAIMFPNMIDAKDWDIVFPWQIKIG